MTLPDLGNEILIASHNSGKIIEINDLLTPYSITAVSVADRGFPVPEETETTFEGNARLKAKARCRTWPTAGAGRR